MTAPIWMAAPPEVHSALLSSGPGPGPLLASAGAWNALSAEYIDAAADLSATLAAVQAAAWDGPSAATYAAAHAPYIAWLLQAAADATTTATTQETTAAAYTTALAAMPTLAELAANHLTHAVLLGTNFFGLNTIPIALNETDYTRMWIQAATTMTAYQGAATAALAASPNTTTAPPIVKADGTSNPADSLSDFLNQIGNIINGFGASAHDETLSSYLFGVAPGTNPLSLFTSDLATDIANYPSVVGQLVNAAGGNPFFIVIAYLVSGFAIVYDLGTQILQFLVTFPALLAVAPLAVIPAALVGLGAGGIVAVTEIALHLGAGAESVPTSPMVPAVSPGSPVASVPSAPAPAPTAPAPAPAPAGAAPAAPAAAPAPGTPPPGAGPGPFPYIVGGTTRMAFQASAKSRAKRKAPAADSAAEAEAAAAAAAREKRKARRKRQTGLRGRDFQYADMDSDFGADAGQDPGVAGPLTPTASDRGAGSLGFAGTARRAAVAGAAGLTTLVGDAFADGPREPMMPSTWDPDAPGAARE